MPVIFGELASASEVRTQPCVVQTRLRDSEIPLHPDSPLPPTDDLSQELQAFGLQNAVPLADIVAGSQIFAVVKHDEPRQYGQAEPGFWLAHVGDEGILSMLPLAPEQPVIVGRSTSVCTYALDDSMLSASHFSATLSGDHLIVRDLASTNGTAIRFAEHEEPEVIAETPDFSVEENLHTKRFVVDFETHRPQDPTELHRQIRAIPELAPVQTIRVGEHAFEMSAIIRGNDYDRAVLYSPMVVNGVEATAPRLLYKSHSDGGWRVTYYPNRGPGGGYVKVAAHGKTGHYVQETKLVPEIAGALEQSPTIADDDNIITSQFEELLSTANKNMWALSTGGEEIDYHENARLNQDLRAVRQLVPGQFYETVGPALAEGCESAGDFLQALDNDLMQAGILPDFNLPPIQIANREHTMLGSTVIESYPAVASGTPITWHMARDTQGRVWIDNITIDNAQASSYGNHTTIFDGGVLTCKPLEYAHHCLDLIDGKEKIDWDEKYVDITPLLNRLLPIRLYKQAHTA